MTLTEAIDQARRASNGTSQRTVDHEQLGKWLVELSILRKVFRHHEHRWFSEIPLADPAEFNGISAAEYKFLEEADW